MASARVFHHRESHRFWSVSLDGKQRIIEYGAIGSSGTRKAVLFKSELEAISSTEKLLASRKGLGYEEVFEDRHQADAWYAKGQSLLRLQKFDKALRCFEQSLEHNQDSIDGWLAKAYCLKREGRHEDALATFDRALQLAPEDTRVWFDQGMFFLGQLAPEKAEACFARVNELDPSHAAAWRQRGLCLEQLGEVLKSSSCFDRVLALNPKDATAWEEKGTALARADQMDGAIRCFRASLAVAAHSAHIHWLRLIDLLFSLELYRAADAVMEVLKNEGSGELLDPVGYWLKRSRIQRCLGSSGEAERCEALALAACSERGSLLYRLGRFEEATEQFGSEASRDPYDFRDWAICLAEIGHPDHALLTLDRGLRLSLDPSSSARALFELTMTRARILKQAARVQDAESVLLETLAGIGEMIRKREGYIGDNDYLDWQQQGLVLVELERPTEAAVCFEQALEKNPFNSRSTDDCDAARIALGRCFVENRRYNRALACFEQVIRGVPRELVFFDPHRVDAWWEKGRVEEKLDRREDATRSFAKFSALCPGFRARDLAYAKERL